MRINNPRDSARNERLDRLAGTRGADGDRALQVSELDQQVAEGFDKVAGRRITARSAALGADVPLAVSGQWYDGPSLGLEPGLYAIHAVAQHRNDGTGAAGVIAARLTDGVSVIATAQQTNTLVAFESLQLALVAILSVPKKRTVTLQMRATAGSSNSRMKATAPDAGSETVATRIVATRVGDA